MKLMRDYAAFIDESVTQADINEIRLVASHLEENGYLVRFVASPENLDCFAHVNNRIVIPWDGYLDNEHVTITNDMARSISYEHFPHWVGINTTARLKNQCNINAILDPHICDFALCWVKSKNFSGEGGRFLHFTQISDVTTFNIRNHQELANLHFFIEDQK